MLMLFWRGEQRSDKDMPANSHKVSITPNIDQSKLINGRLLLLYDDREKVELSVRNIGGLGLGPIV